MNVLVVEDYPNLQKLYSTALTNAGYNVSVASNGTQALKVARYSEPDLILLDLLMPEEDGMRFLQAYQPKAHPKTRVVVFSNMESPELLAETKVLGVDKYLTKTNYTPKQMVAMVDELLSGSKSDPSQDVTQ